MRASVSLFLVLAGCFDPLALPAEAPGSSSESGTPVVVDDDTSTSAEPDPGTTAGEPPAEDTQALDDTSSSSEELPGASTSDASTSDAGMSESSTSESSTSGGEAPPQPYESCEGGAIPCDLGQCVFEPGGGSACAPECDTADDCPPASTGGYAACVDLGSSVFFCLLDCTMDADCPDGMTCFEGMTCLWPPP